MRLWIDTEFNGFNGELISIALVGEDGGYFYAVREKYEAMSLDPWVKEHVIPYLFETPDGHSVILGDDPSIKSELSHFLMMYNGMPIEIIADWPEDIQHMCRFMITGAGEMIPTPPNISFVMDRTIDVESEVPHNALYDALANMRYVIGSE